MGKIKTGIKMKVTPEQSQKVQEICFENGISWFSGKVLKHLDKPYFYINGDSELGYSDKDSQLFFIEDDREEVSAELFIRTNGTYVESEAPTKDNKGEQMEELKLECLVEGYEGTYFEVGQVWETRDGLKLRVSDFNFETDVYKVTLVFKDNYKLHYTKKGEFLIGKKNENDLVKLIINRNESEAQTEITPKEPQPKTLSEYLKENNAYESFVENCVEAFLKDLAWYRVFKSENKSISLGNIFIFEDTKEGYIYWYNLSKEQPENLVDDMNEIIFTEVDKRIAEQKSSTKYMVFVEGRSNPKKVHDSYDSAEKEAKRLSAKEIGCNVSIVSVVKTFKSKVIVEEVK